MYKCYFIYFIIVIFLPYRDENVNVYLLFVDHQLDVYSAVSFCGCAQCRSDLLTNIEHVEVAVRTDWHGSYHLWL